jgi:hypothetical protein
VDRPEGVKKFSPFNTVSRDSRNSYLLRVTHEPNTTSNYYPKYNQILLLERRSTIDKAKFERRIGDVKNDEEYAVEVSTVEPKCLKSHSSVEHRPLTVRESHNWRKTLEHMDFKKQQDSKRLEMPSKKLSVEETTKVDFVKSLQTITESHFNNYRRFSFQSHPEKSHPFGSDSAHQYLREVEDRDRLPEYDILATDESFMHRSMPKTKGEKRFFLYKDQIVTRHDRSDKDWHTFLEYDSTHPNRTAAADFNQTVSRKNNDVHSKYPIRLSLSKPVRVERTYFAN